MYKKKIKDINGKIITLVILKVKDYDNFSLYEIYKQNENEDERHFMYRKCYTKEQLQKLLTSEKIHIEEDE